MILAPERVLAPDEIAVEVLAALRRRAQRRRHRRPARRKIRRRPREAILADVIAMLQDLADKGFLTEAREKTS